MSHLSFRNPSLGSAPRVGAWLRHLLRGEPPTYALNIQIRQRDTILHQARLLPQESFAIGRSQQNPFSFDSPSLPMAHFTLALFHDKGPLIQFTSTMRGFLQRGREMTCLDDLKNTPHVHPTPQGYRLCLPPQASLFLHLDSLLICIRWASCDTEISSRGGSARPFDFFALFRPPLPSGSTALVTRPLSLPPVISEPHPTPIPLSSFSIEPSSGP